MKLPAGVPADWDKDLPAWRDALELEATERPGSWCYRELPIGWRFGVLLGVNGGLHYRFRTPQYPDLVFIEFKAEARRLLGVLGAETWKEREDERRLFWEVTYSAPQGASRGEG